MHNTRMSVDDAVSRVEIVDLFTKYCHAVDRNEFSVFEDIFTDDVVADYSSVEGLDIEPVFYNRADFTAWITEALAPIGPGMTHFMSNHLITLDGDEARVVSLNQVLNVGQGGVYHSHAIKTESGWRIDNIRFEIRYFKMIADKLNVGLANR